MPSLSRLVTGTSQAPSTLAGERGGSSNREIRARRLNDENAVEENRRDVGQTARPSDVGGASGATPSQNPIPPEVAAASPERQALFHAVTQRKLIEAIAALQLSQDEIDAEARSMYPKKYVEQLYMIDASPDVIDDAIMRYTMATEMMWNWTRHNVSEKVIGMYKKRLLAKYHEIYDAYPPEESPVKNQEIGRKIYKEVMEKVSHEKTYDEAPWVDGTSEGQMHHFANGESENEREFVKWHPAYDREVGE